MKWDSSDGRAATGTLWIFLPRVLSSNNGQGGFSLNREKQFFEMNPRKDLNYHAETHLSGIL